MPKITQQRYDEAINVLENSFLIAAAYNVVTEGKNGVLLEISVKDYDQFSIVLREVIEGHVALVQAFNTPRKTYLVSIESPGDYIEDQRTEIDDFAEFLKHLGLLVRASEEETDS